MSISSRLGALEQHAHHTGTGLPFDEVAFTVSMELPVFSLWWTNMDAEHFEYLTPTVLALAARCPFVIGLVQTCDQLPAQLSIGLGVYAFINRLV